MRFFKPLALAAVIAVATFALACSQRTDGDASPVGASVTAISTVVAAPAGTQFGSAGLIPRNFPRSEESDWVAMYERAPEVGPLIGVYGDWRGDGTSSGEVPTVFRAGFAAADRFHSFTPVIGLGFANDDPLTGALTPSVDWTDPTEVANFTAVATGIAAEYQPGFIVVGAEINRIWEQHPATYSAFIAAWPAIYDAMKAVSPATEVGIGFQLEIMRGGGFLTGQPHEVHWHLLDEVREHADFIAFSTYPYLDFETPEALPANYYDEAATQAGLPIAFSEMGWPSRPLSNFPDSGYGGSEAEQVAFAERFLEMIDGLDVRFALWSFQHDIGSTGGPAFESVAVRENDGTAKPVLAVWGAASN
ncbi:MAG: hypothetical protein O3A10_10900 [Chloroflexi bacterium]|nr:hypothetical protein [Chloroflexota bacterium]MDA1148247.1 hypothetical protein [Chloroflexota bacterium]